MRLYFPIPFISFNDKLAKKDFRLFIEAISDDLFQWNNLKQNLSANKGIVFVDESIIKNKTLREVQERKRMKPIKNTSLCFNLRKQNSFPSFFNPPGAKAEFSFMSTCLSDFKIVRVPCYTFCDGFGMYKSILNSVLPARFLPADKASEIVVSKFIKAAINRARSKPLLVFIMQTGNYSKIMRRIKSDLALTIPKLCNYFGTNEFKKIHTELDYYDRNVRRNYNLFSETRRVCALITSGN